MVEVLKQHLNTAVLHGESQILAFQLLYQVFNGHTALGQGGLVAFEGLAAGFKALAGGVQGLILLAGSLVLIQFILLDKQQNGLGIKGQGFAYILVLESLQGLFLLWPLLPRVRLAGKHIVLQRAVSGVGAGQLFFQLLINLVLRGIGIAAA